MLLYRSCAYDHAMHKNSFNLVLTTHSLLVVMAITFMYFHAKLYPIPTCRVTCEFCFPVKFDLYSHTSKTMFKPILESTS